MLRQWLRIKTPEIPTDASRSHIEKMIVAAMLAGLAAILQSMGGFLPGIGYILSPFSTCPIFLVTWLSPKRGILAYLLAMGLLWLIQPSELVVFPFTTGLLGLNLGVLVRWFRNRAMILLLSSVGLTIGMTFVLVILRFPLLGPITRTAFNVRVTIGLLVFSFFYSWLALEGLLFLIKRLFINKETKL